MKANDRRSYEKPLFYLVATLVSSHFAIIYHTGLPFFATYNLLMKLVSDGPDESRILMPVLFRLVFHNRLLNACASHLSRPFNEPLTVFMTIVVAVSIFVTIMAVRSTARQLGVPETIARWGAFVAAYMAYFNYILTPEVRYKVTYDVPQVAFFAICQWAIFRKNRLVYYLAFLTGTFNRESTVFLVPFFAILLFFETKERPTPRRQVQIALEAILQFTLWGAVRYYTTHIFTHGSKTMSLQMWRTNLHFLINPIHLVTIASVFGFLWILYAAQFQRIQHTGLQACALLFIPWILVMWLVGDLLEIRIHGEWTAYMSVCILLIFTNLLADRDTASMQMA